MIKNKKYAIHDLSKFKAVSLIMGNQKFSFWDLIKVPIKIHFKKTPGSFFDYRIKWLLCSQQLETFKTNININITKLNLSVYFKFPKKCWKNPTRDHSSSFPRAIDTSRIYVIIQTKQVGLVWFFRELPWWERRIFTTISNNPLARSGDLSSSVY